MAAKKSGSSDRHKEPKIGFHLSPGLKEAIERYIASKRPKPGLSEVMRTAVEVFLEQEGFWPPKEE